MVPVTNVKPLSGTRIALVWHLDAYYCPPIAPVRPSRGVPDASRAYQVSTVNGTLSQDAQHPGDQLTVKRIERLGIETSRRVLLIQEAVVPV